MLCVSNALGCTPVTFEKLDTGRVVTCFNKYLAASGQAISRALAEERMFDNSQTKISWPMCARRFRRTKPSHLTTRRHGPRFAWCSCISSSAFQAAPGREPLKRQRASACPIWPRAKVPDPNSCRFLKPIQAIIREIHVICDLPPIDFLGVYAFPRYPFFSSQRQAIGLRGTRPTPLR